MARASERVGLASRVVRLRHALSMATRLSDDVGEPGAVGFVTENSLGKKADEDAQEDYAALQTVNKRLLAQIEQQGKSITIPTEESKKIQRREEDLNGVNPFYAMLGAVVAGVMSFGSWKATVWLAGVYYSNPAPESDILAVARLTAFLKQAVVGMFALGTGVFGVNALGMGIMSGIVLVGVAKGELDPSPRGKADAALYSLRLQRVTPRNASLDIELLRIWANASKTAPAGASAEEVDRLMLKEAEEKLRRAQADIERELGGNV